MSEFASAVTEAAPYLAMGGFVTLPIVYVWFETVLHNKPDALEAEAAKARRGFQAGRAADRHH